jgi:CheY-like chemotaxis protein
MMPEEAEMMPRGRVLVVDDNQEIVALLRDLLALEGYQVHAAVGDLVLPLARAVHPDLILLDAHMPGQDGATVSHRLRADPTTAAIPRVVVTADPDLRTRAAEMGAVAAVGKPFELPALLRCVARWAGPLAPHATT